MEGLNRKEWYSMTPNMTSEVASAYKDILDRLGTAVKGPAEIKVSPERLLERAKWMRDHHGYQHSFQSLRALEDYIRGYGIYLCGRVGTGKTFFFKAVGERNLRFYSLLANMAKKLDDIEEEINDLQGSDLVIDDIGAEPVYNNFGSRLDLLPWLIERRMMSPCRTHFTTNDTPEVLLKRYGARVMDRVCGMARYHELDGESKRVPRPVAKI